MHYATLRQICSTMFLLALLGVASRPMALAASGRYFPETRHTLAEPMRGFWDAHGGLPVFGYPISEAFGERSRDTGATYPTQYFERNRLEYHPENTLPYQVLLGRLGDEALKQQGRDWMTFPRAASTAAHYVAETGHAIAHEPFWSYYRSHGLELDGKPGFSPAESLALWGLPLSEPQIETNTSGDRVLTQWFERARFEDHGPRGVLLGLLGNETTAARRGETPFQPVGTGNTPPGASSPSTLELHAAGQRLFELTNRKRQTELGKAPYEYRHDLQVIADQIARDWTAARKSGGNSRAVIEKYNEQLGMGSPAAGVIYATLDVYLEAGCRTIDPNDPGAKAVSPYVAQYDAKTLTIGVYGPYSSNCGRAFTSISVIGF